MSRMFGNSRCMLGTTMMRSRLNAEDTHTHTETEGAFAWKLAGRLHHDKKLFRHSTHSTHTHTLSVRRGNASTYCSTSSTRRWYQRRTQHFLLAQQSVSNNPVAFVQFCSD